LLQHFCLSIDLFVKLVETEAFARDTALRRFAIASQLLRRKKSARQGDFVSFWNLACQLILKRQIRIWSWNAIQIEKVSNCLVLDILHNRPAQSIDGLAQSCGRWRDLHLISGPSGFHSSCCVMLTVCYVAWQRCLATPKCVLFFVLVNTTGQKGGAGELGTLSAPQEKVGRRHKKN
jgi:hypothetical protein